MSFSVGPSHTTEYMNIWKTIYEQSLIDSPAVVKYGPIIPLPLDYVLLTQLYEGRLRLYSDYFAFPDYEIRATTYINDLLAKKQVYSLCLIAAHSHPTLAAKSIIALQQLDDARCIPFLLGLAQYKSDQILTANIKHLSQPSVEVTALIAALHSLTRCVPLPAYGSKGIAIDMMNYNDVWKNQIAVYEPVFY